MVDNFSIALSHALIALAAWRLLHRPDLDFEAPPPADEERPGFAKRITGWAKGGARKGGWGGSDA